MVSVNKGDWDKSRGEDAGHAFNKEWLKACREKLKGNGTIWISGTYHNIFSIAKNLTELSYKILNCVTWVKTNSPLGEDKFSAKLVLQVLYSFS